MRLEIPKDVIIIPEINGCWVAMNVFSKTCLAIESESVAVLACFGGQSRSEVEKHYAHNHFKVWDIQRFSNEDGLVADPTRYSRNQEDWPALSRLSISQLIDVCIDRFLLIEDREHYLSLFKTKESLLDKNHFGNFHQQLGQHLMLPPQRKNPDRWWLQQKFNPELKGVRDNLYGAVQAHALDTYFKEKLKKGSYLVDFGCGPGFFSNMIAKNGLSVLGLDPNEEFVAIARANAVAGAKFEVADLGQKECLQHLPENSVDYVFMSDALLFYFVSVLPGAAVPDIRILLKDIKRVLKPEGKIISVEPHYLFWLSPWLGEIDRPFTVFTEYMHKSFGVTATISQFIQAFNKSGFGVTWMEELMPGKWFREIDPRAYHFARQFPIWQLFEFKKVQDG